RNQPGAHADSARWRVLHGVADEIHEDLTQVCRIGAQTGQRCAYGNRKVQSTFVHERFELARHVQHEWSQRNRLWMYLETPSSDLRDVEHLVDEMPQMRRRRGDAIDRRHLPRREVAVNTV